MPQPLSAAATITVTTPRTESLRLDPARDPYPLAVIVGPTASGKSELALAAASRFGGEIVNFDSVQIYRGFDVGSAKLPVEQRRGIPHHLIDITDPEQPFSAGDYARRAAETLAEIRGRGRLPVMVGGTGFYLRALLGGLFPGPGRDAALRRRLERRAAESPAGYLHRLLRKLDAASAQRIHANDTAKLIRAIEVCLLESRPMSETWRQGRTKLEGFKAFRIGLDPPRAALYARIDRRSRRMFDAGLLDEVRELLRQTAPRTARAFGSLGYKQALQHIDGRLTLEEAVAETAKFTRRYAKRQMTWFRREPDVHWLKCFGDDSAAASALDEFLQQAIGPSSPPASG